MADPKLTFKIYADSKELDRELGKTIKNINDTGRVADGLARKFGVDLPVSQEKTIASLLALQQHLIKIHAPAQDIEAATVRLTTAQLKLAHAQDLAGGAFGRVSGFMKEHALAIGGTITAVGGALVAFGSKALTEFAKQEQVLAGLNAVLTSTGGVAGVTQEQVVKLADGMSKLTGIDDEALVSAQSVLLTFTNIGKDVFPRVTKSVTDMAVAMNGGAIPTQEQLRDAALKLGKALENPIQGMSMLRRVGVIFSDSQKEVIKRMVEVGDTAGAQAKILEVVEKRYGGAAVAAGETFAGQVGKAQVAVGNFYEDAGGKLAPILQNLMKSFPDAAVAVIGLKDALGGLNVTAGDLLIALPTLSKAIVGVGTAASVAVGTGARGLGAFGLALSAAAAAAYTMYQAVTVLIAKQGEAAATTQSITDAMKQSQVAIDKGVVGIVALRSAYIDGETTLDEFLRDMSFLTIAHQQAHPEMWKVVAAQVAIKEKIDYTRPTLQQQIRDTELEIKGMRTLGVEAELVWKAEDKLADLKKKLKDETDKAAKAIEDAEKKLKAFEKQVASTKVELGKYIEQQFKWVDKLQLEIPESVKQTEELEAAFKTLGVTSGLAFADTAEAAKEAYATILFDARSTTDQIDKAWVKMVEAQIAAGEDLDSETMVIYRGMTDKIEKETKKISDVWSKQVSTIITDLSSGLADAILSFGGFAESLKKIFTGLGKSILRIMLEDTLGKMVKSFMEKLPSWVAPVAVGVGIVVGALIGHFTRRGKEKETATGAVEEMSSKIWNDIIPAARAGKISVDEARVAINQLWADYEKFLNDNLKDQTVITRSIESQKMILLDTKVVLDELEIKQSKVSGLTTQLETDTNSLKNMMDTLLATGQGSDSLTPIFEKWGGSLEALNAATQLPGLRAMSGMIGEWQDAIGQFLPVQQSLIEAFLATGVVSADMAAKIAEAGGNLEAFERFGAIQKSIINLDAIMASGDLSALDPNMMGRFGMSAQGGQLSALLAAYGNQEAMDLWNQGKVQAAMEIVMAAMKTARSEAASALAVELQIMQDATTAAIKTITDDLKVAFDTAIAAMVAAFDASIAALQTVVTPPVTPNGEEETSAWGVRPKGYPENLPWPPAGAQSGGFFERPQLARLHAMEYVIPADMLRGMMTGAAGGGLGGRVGGGRLQNLTVQFYGQRSTWDEIQQLERLQYRLAMQGAL